ncbi:MAG: hypothetical protein AB7Q04_02955 [Steroidobacteraceae bacterium]
MDILPQLSPAQNLLLRAAARRTDGRVIPPGTLRGGARVKVLTCAVATWLDRACRRLPRADRRRLRCHRPAAASSAG